MARACTGNRLHNILNCFRGSFVEKQVTEHQDRGRQISEAQDPVRQLIALQEGKAPEVNDQRHGSRRWERPGRSPDN